MVNEIQSEQRFPRSMASYFNVAVQVLVQMEHCSLVEYGGREFVVTTDDLCFPQAMEQAA